MREKFKREKLKGMENLSMKQKNIVSLGIGRILNLTQVVLHLMMIQMLKKLILMEAKAL